MKEETGKIADKVAVLGSSDFTMPFSALGLDAFPAENSEQSLESAEKIIEQGYALVVVSEDIAPAAEKAFSEVQNRAKPCVVVMPFTRESTGFATQSLNWSLRLATGIDIMKRD